MGWKRGIRLRYGHAALPGSWRWRRRRGFSASDWNTRHQSGAMPSGQRTARRLFHTVDRTYLVAEHRFNPGNRGWQLALYQEKCPLPRVGIPVEFAQDPLRIPASLKG